MMHNHWNTFTLVIYWGGIQGTELFGGTRPTAQPLKVQKKKTPLLNTGSADNQTPLFLSLLQFFFGGWRLTSVPSASRRFPSVLQKRCVASFILLFLRCLLCFWSAFSNPTLFAFGWNRKHLSTLRYLYWQSERTSVLMQEARGGGGLKICLFKWDLKFIFTC